MADKTLSALGLHARGGADPVITGLAVDNRQVESGFLFAAMPGTNTHGVRFIPAAVEAGAVAILTDAEGAAQAGDLDDTALVIAEDPREALPSYDAMLMLSPRIADDEGVAAALQPLIGAISVEDMREANFSVDREGEGKASPREAAQALAEKIGL